MFGSNSYLRSICQRQHDDTKTRALRYLEITVPLLTICTHTDKTVVMKRTFKKGMLLKQLMHILKPKDTREHRRKVCQKSQPPILSPIRSGLIAFYSIPSCPVGSWPIPFCRILSYPFQFHPKRCYATLYQTTMCIIPHHITPCHVTSHHAISHHTIQYTILCHTIPDDSTPSHAPHYTLFED